MPALSDRPDRASGCCAAGPCHGSDSSGCLGGKLPSEAVVSTWCGRKYTSVGGALEGARRAHAAKLALGRTTKAAAYIRRRLWSVWRGLTDASPAKHQTGGEKVIPGGLGSRGEVGSCRALVRAHRMRSVSARCPCSAGRQHTRRASGRDHCGKRGAGPIKRAGCRDGCSRPPRMQVVRKERGGAQLTHPSR